MEFLGIFSLVKILILIRSEVNVDCDFWLPNHWNDSHIEAIHSLKDVLAEIRKWFGSIFSLIMISSFVTRLARTVAGPSVRAVSKEVSSR